MNRIIFFLILLFPGLVDAQTKDSSGNYVASKIIDFSKTKVKYKSTVVSVPYREVRDEGQSPLLYRGPTLQVAKYNERWRKKSMTKFEMVLGGGLIQTNKHRVDAQTKGALLNMEVNYHYMVPFKKILKGRGDWYLGAILTNTFDGRLYSALINNSFGYEFSNAINPATHFTYNFKMGQQNRAYQAGFKLNFSLLAHVIRPNFIGMEPAETYMDENIHPFAIFTHDNRIALPNHFFRINTEVYFDRFKIGNNDKIRIFYGWGLHVTTLSQSNPLYAAYHNIGFVSMLYSEKSKKEKRAKNLK